MEDGRNPLRPRRLTLAQAVSDCEGPTASVHTRHKEGRYPLCWLTVERCVSINTTAAGGNAQLMMIG